MVQAASLIQVYKLTKLGKESKQRGEMAQLSKQLKKINITMRMEQQPNQTIPPLTHHHSHLSIHRSHSQEQPRTAKSITRTATEKPRSYHRPNLKVIMGI